MKKMAFKTISTLFRAVGKENSARAIKAIAAASGIDLLVLAYNEMGILKYQDSMVSGEFFLVSVVLKKFFNPSDKIVMFDVGANVGSYAQLLSKEFPATDIYAFEPHKDTFAQLVQNVNAPIKCINIGLGSEEKVERIYTYADGRSSVHASTFKEVFKVFHKTNEITYVDFKMKTLDNFCMEENIATIDFLKIDAEGNELNVLKGAKKMIAEDRIKIIQFEFGECDVFSRVFLRDFYEILPNYEIYRLNTNELIPFIDYDSTNEIFRFQNFVAINKKLTNVKTDKWSAI